MSKKNWGAIHKGGQWYMSPLQLHITWPKPSEPLLCWWRLPDKVESLIFCQNYLAGIQAITTIAAQVVNWLPLASLSWGQTVKGTRKTQLAWTSLVSELHSRLNIAYKKKRLRKIRGPLSSQNEQNTGSILFSNWWICLQSYLIKTIKLNNPQQKLEKSTLNITFRVFTKGGNIFSRIA